MASTTGRISGLMGKLMNSELEQEAKRAIPYSTKFWGGIEWFLKWLRTKMSEFFEKRFCELSFVGRWAGRIGMAVTEFSFTVLETFVGYMKIAFTSPSLWIKAHASSVLAWEANEFQGLVTQIYAYGRKMATYYLEVIRQCLERAIATHDQQATDNDKLEIEGELNKILG